MPGFRKANSIKGETSVAGDKSISHRAVMLGAIAGGDVTISNFPNSGDCLSTVSVMRGLGAEIIENARHCLTGRGRGLYGLKAPAKQLYAGNSGTTIRLASGLLAGQKFNSSITGDGSLLKRPMDRIIGPLRKMGADIKSEKDKYPPLEIKGGGLNAADHKLPLASAQVKSCILLAGLYAEGTTSVKEPYPSRNHTELMLGAMGIKITGENGRTCLKGGRELKAVEVNVPGDISSAAFLIVAALITPGSELLVKNVGVNPTRTGLLDVLNEMGADIMLENRREANGEPVADIRVKHSGLKAANVGAEIIPRLIDEIPVLAVAAARAEGKTVITGAGELRVKETDRIAAVCGQLKNMGADIEECEDGLAINGPVDLHGGQVCSYGDHRMAMALRVAALVADKDTVIDDVDCINISFPGFLEKIDELSK